MSEIHRPFEFPGELVDPEDFDTPITPEETAAYKDELSAIEEAERAAAEDHGIVLG